MAIFDPLTKTVSYRDNILGHARKILGRIPLVKRILKVYF